MEEALTPASVISLPVDLLFAFGLSGWLVLSVCGIYMLKGSSWA